MANVGRARFRQMYRNLVIRIAQREIDEDEAKQMKLFKDIRLHIKLIWVAILILALLQLSGCSGNYRLGDTSKIYCAAVTYDPAKQLEVTTVKSGDDTIETTVEH